MVINHAGALSQDYFKSYIKLVMTTNNCSLQESKNIVFEHLFKANKSRFGEGTYQNFLLAYQKLENEIA